jgi:pSer/pThr/pTyr-binding forkhead associated (FHA) protein
MPRVTITVPEKTPQPYRFQLDRQVVSLGRGSENDIPIECGSVSVKHAEMLRVDGGYELRDVGSTNGIKLDGERREVIPLKSGLTVKLGDVSFDFTLSDEEQEALAKEKSSGGTAIQQKPEAGDIDLPPARAASRKPVMVNDTSRGGFGMILLFLILAAAAFLAGMAVRFQKETGASLLEAVNSKSEQSAPAKSTPAQPGATAPATVPDAPKSE